MGSPRPRGVQAIANGSALALSLYAANASAQALDQPAAKECSSADKTCFLLTGLQIDGAGAVSQEEFAPLYEASLTRYVNRDDLERIATEITDLYRQKGYFLSRAYVPEQSGDGVARIVVVEGRITEIEVQGSAKAQIEALLRDLTASPITNLKVLDNRLALAADRPGVTLRSRIEPIAGRAGEHRLVIVAEHAEIQGFASLDNRGPHAAGPMNFYGRVLWNGAVDSTDQVAANVFTTPAEVSEYTQGQLSYTYVADGGTRLTMEGSVSRAQSSGPSSLSTTRDSDSEGLSLRAETPLLRGRYEGVWLTAAIDARDFRREGAGVTEYKDRVRAARVGLRGFMERDGDTTSLWSTVSLGLDGLGASDGPSPTHSRADAEPDTLKIAIGGSRYERLSAHWGVSLSVDGQWTDEPLLLSEEFAIGQQPYGRAYDYGEISGDRGIASSVELRAGYDPKPKLVTYLQGYLFADAGRVWNYNMPPSDDSYEIASAGFGTRLTIEDRMTLTAELAKPLTRPPAENRDKDWRGLFSIAVAR